MNAVVIGYGVVGKSTAKAFGITKHFDINGDSNITINEIANCRYVFICLPTPTIEGKCDTTAIRECIKQIEGIRQNPIYIIRSTVIPGTADAIMDELGMDRVISNPEFLSEATAEKDAKHPDMIVIGGRSDQCLREVKGIYEARFKYISPLLTNNVTAEMVKYTFNTFFALKVVFANEIFDICQKNKANYSVIKDLLTNHKWGSGNHFEVYYKGERGVRGKCLPKDLEAFQTYSQSWLLKAAQEINNGIK